MRAFYDTGALIAADRSDRRVWADHRARLELGTAPVTTAPVVAQASRTPPQVQLRRFLRGCQVVPFSPSEAFEVGTHVGRSGVADVVDVHLVLAAAVVTFDPADLARVADSLAGPVRIIAV